MRLQLRDLNRISTLVRDLNSRCFPQIDQNANLPDTTTVHPSKFSLTILRFRTFNGVTSGNGSQSFHDFKADYVLGLSHGNISVGDKILSFPYASADFALSLSEQSTKHLMGALRWVYNPESNTFGRSHRIWNETDFPTYKGLLLDRYYHYLYPKFVLKMTAEEILQLTPDLRKMCLNYAVT